MTIECARIGTPTRNESLSRAPHLNGIRTCSQRAFELHDTVGHFCASELRSGGLPVDDFSLDDLITTVLNVTYRDWLLTKYCFCHLKLSVMLFALTYYWSLFVY